MEFLCEQKPSSTRWNDYVTRGSGIQVRRREYEEEKHDTGMTGLAGLPVYLDLMHAMGLPELIGRHLQMKQHGNVNGLGLADVTTKKLVEAIDWNATLMNVRTTGFWDRAFCPPFPGSDQDAILWALKGMKVSEDQTVSVTRIRNTLHMEELWLNEHAFASAEMCERVSGYIPLSFDAHGYLLSENWPHFWALPKPNTAWTSVETRMMRMMRMTATVTPSKAMISSWDEIFKKTLWLQKNRTGSPLPVLKRRSCPVGEPGY
jgi:hypothetical protein